MKRAADPVADGGPLQITYSQLALGRRHAEAGAEESQQPMQCEVQLWRTAVVLGSDAATAMIKRQADFRGWAAGGGYRLSWCRRRLSRQVAWQVRLGLQCTQEKVPGS